MTPYAQMLATRMRPEAQATFGYEYQRYAKEPSVAFMLTLLLGVVGGESYYFGNYARGILMSLAFFTGIGLLITVPMWICRCFTVQGECETYNDYLAYLLASRYWQIDDAANVPQPPVSPVQKNVRPNIGGLPMPVRTISR